MSPFVTLLALAGCGTPPTADCRATVDAWTDADGDGYGGEAIGKVCALDDGQAGQPLDCDDGDDTRNPDIAETCDGIDNDCNGIVDDGTDLKQYWQDGDGDGYGAEFQSQLACEKPGDGWVKNADDCDDADGAIHPGVMEVCGGGDEDCDGYLDDADDDNLDPASLNTFFRDSDGDGYGDPKSTMQSCRLAEGYVVDNRDCDDRDPQFAFNEYFTDADGDGFGDPATSVVACRPIPGTSTDGTDCNDANPDVHEVSNWVEDLDGDGYGAGVPVLTQCDPPGLGLVSSADGYDCDESNPSINPGESEICEDGIDQDCDGADPSCGPIGLFHVNDGPAWGNDPPVYSCIEACALLFGGAAADYHCSTSATVLDYSAYLSGWGDLYYCTHPRPDDYSLEPAGNPGYNCGGFGCAYSAYVQDNCYATPSTNYCWPN